jgi:hypothetical protein
VVHSELKLTYDGKRDRYNGYDPAAYKGVMDRCVGYPCTGSQYGAGGGGLWTLCC